MKPATIVPSGQSVTYEHRRAQKTQSLTIKKIAVLKLERRQILQKLARASQDDPELEKRLKYINLTIGRFYIGLHYRPLPEFE